jgi:GMP synthase (glutamine-hydrolysing)
MKIHFVIHETFEGPAAIEQWAIRKGHQVSYSNVFAGDKLPHNADAFDLLIVMGGPQSPATTQAECPHFDSAAEQALIRQAVNADKAVLGVCLGAQLLGNALGAQFEHSPHKEIGVFDVTLTDAAKDDPIFSRFPSSFPAGHWHGDMPGLTADAEVLAYSAGCPRQIIRYAPKVYGFQCHFEFTKEAVAGYIKHGEHELKAGGKYVWDEETLLNYDYSEMNELVFGVLEEMEGW